MEPPIPIHRALMCIRRCHRRPHEGNLPPPLPPPLQQEENIPPPSPPPHTKQCVGLITDLNKPIHSIVLTVATGNILSDT